MSIIDTALIGKLKKTKADKTNVLQLDNDVAYTPHAWYHPSTKKYVDDTVASNKLQSIHDWLVVSLYDQKTSSSVGDLSSIPGDATTQYVKNYSRSLYLQNESLVLPVSDSNTPMTIEGWFYYLDNDATNTAVLEVGGDLGNGKSQWCRVFANGGMYMLDVTGTYGGQIGGGFTPVSGWVHYAMYVGQTDFCVWINGVRQTYGNFTNNVSGDYRQTVPRTYVALGTKATTNPIVAPFGAYDSVRVSTGDRYGISNASFTPPSLFSVDGSTKHLYHVESVNHAWVDNEIFVHTPTSNYHAATKLYVDTAIANIPVTVDTNTFVTSGSVIGTTLTLYNNNGSTVNINVASLLDDTTNTISSGTLFGNYITFTRQDGTQFNVDVAALYDDTNIVTSVNGQTGDVSIPPVHYVVSGAVVGNQLRLVNNDSTEVTIDVTSLAQNYFVESIALDSATHILTLSRSGGIGSLSVDLSSLIGSTFNQSLNTSDNVNFNNIGATQLNAISVIANHFDGTSLNINGAIDFGTVSGAPNQVIITKADGGSWWSDVKTINGASLIGTGNITTPDTRVTSGSVNLMGQWLRLTNSDSSVVDIDVSHLINTDWGQTLYTTSNVNFNKVTTPFVSADLVNTNKLTFNTTSGAVNQLVSADINGNARWTDIKTINGTSLLGAGDITITANGIDTYVTSGTVSGSILTLTHNTGSTVSINVGALLDDTTNTVSSGTLVGNVIRFTRQNGTTFDVDVAALYDDTNIVTSVNGQTGAVTVTDTNYYVNSATLVGNVLTLGRTGGLSNVTVDLSALKTTDTDNYVDSATLNGNTLVLGRSGSLPDLTVDLSTLHGVDNYIDSATLSGNTLVLGRTGTLPDLTVDLSSLGGGTGGTINGLIQREHQDFTATAGQTVFTTTFTLNDVEVFYNGLKLDNEDYTAVGHTLTLLEAAEGGDNIEVIAYGNGVAVDAAYEKYTFDVTTPTSVFNVAYAIGQVEVFFNGMKLTETEYVADNGTTVTLTLPALAGDYVEIITMIATTSGNYYTKAEVDQMIAGAGTGSSTTTGLTTQVIDTFSTSAYRSGEYLLTVTGSGFMTLKMIVLFNGTVALNSQYGQLGDDLGTFDTIVNGSNVQILFTPIDQNSTVQFSRTLIENIGGGTPSQTLPTDLNTGSGTVDLNSGSGVIDLNGTIIPTDLNAGSGVIDLLAGTGTNDLNQ